MKKYYRVITIQWDSCITFDFAESKSIKGNYASKEEAVHGFIKECNDEIRRLSELQSAAKTALLMAKAINKA